MVNSIIVFSKYVIIVVTKIINISFTFLLDLLDLFGELRDRFEFSFLLLEIGYCVGVESGSV